MTTDTESTIEPLSSASEATQVAGQQVRPRLYMATTPHGGVEYMGFQTAPWRQNNPAAGEADLQPPDRRTEATAGIESQNRTLPVPTTQQQGEDLPTQNTEINFFHNAPWTLL